MAEQKLERKVLSGVVWSFSEKFLTMAVQMAVSIIVARRLLPEDFGVMAILTFFTSVALTIVDSGFSQTLIRRQNPTDEEYRSVLGFNIIMSLLLYVILVAAARPIATFYGHSEIAAVAPVLRQPAVIKTPDDFSGVVLRAYGEGHDYSFECSNILEGSLPEQNTDLMISALTSRRLGLSMGDKVDVCFFIDGALKLRRLSVCGIYSSNFGDYDRLTAYVTYPMLQRLRRLSDNIADEIEIRNVPFDQVSDASALVQKNLTEKYDVGELQGGVTVTTLYDTGAVYFNWLGLLDANVVVILIIMSLVSGFTLISCVFILILQRVRMIGVLKSLGATDGQIRRVFILLGIRVVGIGLLIGDVAGVTLVLLQNRFHAVPLNPEAYFLTYVPVVLRWQKLLLVNCGALLLAALLLLVPAQLVSRISPAKTMHFE